MTENVSNLTVGRLLHEAGLHGPFAPEQLLGGANNRVYRVQGETWSALLKVYFRHPQDPRDRLAAEFAFCSFALQVGLHFVPRPLACDRENSMGLYEFIPGRLPEAHEAGLNFVEQALEFFCALNQFRGHPEASALPVASEACFSLAQHLYCVERRVTRLTSIGHNEAIDRDAARFVTGDLMPVWQILANSVRDKAARHSAAMDMEIEESNRCLSPSDFGFHNAIVGSDGKLRFIDLEYAGWDDPAKTVCDFFWQPKVPVSLGFYDLFTQKASALAENPEVIAERCEALLPVYGMKWCCIMLNDFLPIDGERRRFSADEFATAGRKAMQLQKAKNALERLKDLHGSGLRTKDLVV